MSNKAAASQRPMKSVQPDAVIGPKPPAQVEAEGDVVAYFQWRDVTYEVPATADEWPLEAQEAMEDMKIAQAVKAILGEKQYTTLRKDARKVKDLGEFFDAMAKALGFDSAGG